MCASLCLDSLKSTSTCSHTSFSLPSQTALTSIVVLCLSSLGRSASTGSKSSSDFSTSDRKTSKLFTSSHCASICRKVTGEGEGKYRGRWSSGDGRGRQREERGKEMGEGRSRGVKGRRRGGEGRRRREIE